MNRGVAEEKDGWRGVGVDTGEGRDGGVWVWRWMDGSMEYVGMEMDGWVEAGWLDMEVDVWVQDVEIDGWMNGWMGCVEWMEGWLCGVEMDG